MVDMPKHRQETRGFERTTTGIIALALGSSATMLVMHGAQTHSQEAETFCTVVPNYPEKIPDEDIDMTTIQKALNISHYQLNFVKAYAATCHTPLNPEQFSAGLPRSPREFNDMFNTTYDRCAMYGVAKQLIPPTGNETAPAVLVCIDLPEHHSNEVQI
jgi:hypothetical protein